MVVVLQINRQLLEIKYPRSMGLQKLQNRAIRVITESSCDTTLILVPDFFLTRLVGRIYRLEGLNKRLI